jgi:hypothetical protein
MAENGYTTISHDGNKEVTIHKSDTLTKHQFINIATIGVD